MLAARHHPFGEQEPLGGEFFTRNGLLFLSVKEVQDVADQLIAAQPLLGSLAADPNLRGLFSAISLALQGVKNGEIKLAGMASEFYRQRVGQHLEIGLKALERLKLQESERLHSRKLRSFAEVAFQ